jgi:hypothetical protein
MAISKEMKAYINKRFDEKIANINKEYNDALTKEQKSWEKESKAICDLIVKPLMEEMKLVKKQIQELGLSTCSYFNHCCDNISNIYYVNGLPKDKTIAISKPYKDAIEILNKEREMLLIKLSMEKDFDKVNAMLKDYGIGLE